MAEELNEPPERIHLFNSSLETGIRAIVVLEAFFPRTFDLLRLTWLDHLVVHTGDIEGPQSLHPDLPQRDGELLVRRRLVEEGISLMRCLHYIELLPDANGIHYRTCEGATALIDSLRSEYSRNLKDRASWLAQTFENLTDEDISAVVANKIGRLVVEFQVQFDHGNSSR
jgi:hypothetical protein